MKGNHFWQLQLVEIMELGHDTIQPLIVQLLFQFLRYCINIPMKMLPKETTTSERQNQNKNFLRKLNVCKFYTWPSACIKKEASLRTALQNGCGGQAPCNTVEKAVLDWVKRSSFNGSPIIIRKHISVVDWKWKTILTFQKY